MNCSLWPVLVAATIVIAFPAYAQPEVHTQNPIRFAVIAFQANETESKMPWLGRGIVFDLEKRLERWRHLENADRMQMRAALRKASSDDAPAAVLGPLNLDCVITVSAVVEDDGLTMTLAIWTDTVTPAHSFTLMGAPEDLLGMNDKAIEKIIGVMVSLFPKLPCPDDTKRLELHPAQSVEAYGLTVRGMIALQDGRPAEARPFLEQAVANEPNQWWAHYFLGAADFHQGRYSEAVEQCRAAIAIDPELYAAVYANLSYCYIGLGDTTQAQWAKSEFERRTGKVLPSRGAPGGMGFPAGGVR